MGDIADMMIEGLLDEETGELIDGEAPGYPRTVRDRARIRPEGKNCPVCSKRLKSVQGVEDHIRAKHTGD